MSADPDNIYLDLATINNDTTGLAVRNILNFTEQRTNPILYNPSNYYLSVARFSLDTPAVTLPIFIPKLLIDGSNNDPNTTCYSITMAVPSSQSGLLTNVKQAYVEWSPEDQTALPPNNQTITTTVEAPLPPSLPKADPTYSQIYNDTNTAGTFASFTSQISPVIPTGQNTNIKSNTCILSVPATTTNFIWTAVYTSGIAYFVTIAGFNAPLPFIMTPSTLPLFKIGNYSYPIINPIEEGVGASYYYRFTLYSPQSIPNGKEPYEIEFLAPPLVSGYLVSQVANVYTFSNPYVLPQNPASSQNPATITTTWSKVTIQLIIETPDPPPPPAPSTYITSQNILSGYYNCYSARWWLSCLNRTLNKLWLQYEPTQPQYSPQLTIDDNTNLITLLTPFTTQFNFSQNTETLTATTPYYIGGTAPTAPTFCLFMNEPLFNLLSGFPSVYYGTTIRANQLDVTSQAIVGSNYSWFNYYVVPINYKVLNQMIQGTPPATMMVTTSEVSPVPLWNPVKSIVFQTSLLHIVVSMTSVPNFQNTNIYDTTYTTGGGANFIPMLTDIAVNTTSGGEYKPNITYVPASEYRLIDMLGSNPISQASFGVAYKTKYGEVIAFKLGSQCGANIKLMFRRKRFNLMNYEPYNMN
jgi:hypothetical protein